MPEDKKETEAVKRTVLAVVYQGMLSQCSVGKLGLFTRNVPVRLTTPEYQPPSGLARITEEQARQLVAEHEATRVDFVRDKQGEIIHGADGLPKTRAVTSGPFAIVQIEESD